MLASFIIRRTFNKLCVSLYIDCERKEESAIVKYDGIIVWNGSTGTSYTNLDTPEKAERWLAGNIDTGRGGTASRIEHLEYQARHGFLKVQGE